MHCPSYCNLPGICHKPAWFWHDETSPTNSDKKKQQQKMFFIQLLNTIIFLSSQPFISFLFFMAHTHIFTQNSVLHTTCQEEQISLSTEIKNHYFDSFTNSFDPECGRQITGCCPVMIWTIIFVHVQAHKGWLLLWSRHFRKLSITSLSDTLHAIASASLATMPNCRKRQRTSTREADRNWKKEGEGAV